MILLSDLPQGKKARIVKVNDDFLNLQMIAKGLTIGTEIELSRKTLLGSCLYLRCASHSLAIQNDLAKHIYVEEL